MTPALFCFPPSITIDLLHDLLRPLNAGGDQLVRSGASLHSPEQVIGRFHVQARQDGGHDADHPLAPLIHRGGILYFRLLFA